MRNECSIIKDLLPLYAEEMVSDDTAAFIAEHLKGCEGCREEYERIRDPKPVQKSDDAAPLQALSRKLKVKRIQTIILTAVFVAALIVSAFAVLGAPIYLPYSKGLVTVEKYGDAGISLSFDESVRHFAYTVHDDPDGGVSGCDIEAWTTLWDKWFSKRRENLSAAIKGRGEPMLLFYVSNDASENICLAKYDPDAVNQIEIDGETKGVTTLPRLVLGYYLILASAALAILAVVWLFTRKNAGVRVWVERIALYPAAYIASHCIVSGVNWATYSISRDFTFILFLSVLLYGGFLLLHNVILLKKQIKKQQ